MGGVEEKNKFSNYHPTKGVVIQESAIILDDSFGRLSCNQANSTSKKRYHKFIFYLFIIIILLNYFEKNERVATLLIMFYPNIVQQLIENSDSNQKEMMERTDLGSSENSKIKIFISSNYMSTFFSR